VLAEVVVDLEALDAACDHLPQLADRGRVVDVEGERLADRH
jgi:hypothetical protein